MNRPDLRRHVSQYFRICMETFDEKSTDYESDLEDCFSGIRDAAREGEVSPLRVMFLYWLKHYTPFRNFVLGRKLNNEGIRSRMIDLTVYLAMMDGLISESGKTTGEHRKDETSSD